MMLSQQPVPCEQAELNRQVLAVVTRMVDVRSNNELKEAVWSIFKDCYSDEIEKYGGGTDSVFDVWMLYGR